MEFVMCKILIAEFDNCYFQRSGLAFQILFHTQARRRQSWLVFNLSSSIGLGGKSFSLATLNRKTSSGSDPMRKEEPHEMRKNGGPLVHYAPFPYE
jgi:hypothetical protein